MENPNPIETQKLEECLVRHGAPTLAGVKPANMFSCRIKSAHCCGNPRCSSFSALGFVNAFRDCRLRLAPCGLELAVLAQRDTGPLLYLYRPAALEGYVLGNVQVRGFLAELGYDLSSTRAALGTLMQRIARYDLNAGKRGYAFPHEVGLFLGYPLGDVRAFMERDGSGACLSCGYWKVYSNERAALECFGRYQECTERLLHLHGAGARLEQLVSAGARHDPLDAVA